MGIARPFLRRSIVAGRVRPGTGFRRATCLSTRRNGPQSLLVDQRPAGGGGCRHRARHRAESSRRESVSQLCGFSSTRTGGSRRAGARPVRVEHRKGRRPERVGARNQWCRRPRLRDGHRRGHQPPGPRGPDVHDGLQRSVLPGGWMEFDGNGNPVASLPHDSWIHGTHVSGTIAGDSMGGTAIGVAPGIWLMMGLVLPGGGGTFAEVIAGMQWCVSPFDLNGNPTPPAHVQSMSWGDTGGGLQQQLLDPIKNSLLAGVIPVAAIGNEGQGSARSPGDIWGTFGAGATDINDNVASFSSGKSINWPSPPTDWPIFGGWPSQPYLKPDFSAPGVNIRSAAPGGGYQNLDGTSMATPHVSATVGLMVEASGISLTPEQAYNNLRNSVVDLGAPGQDDRYGWGRIDTYKAVLLSLVANTGVKGTVYDSASQAGLKDVKVTAQELGAYTTTDANGTFKMGLPEGSYNISFDKFGYISQFRLVDVVLYNGTVNGYVTDAAAAPITGASVTFTQANLTVYTDSLGYFTASVKNGSY